MHPTLVIGLDGATFEVLKPLINQEVMPEVGKLVESGVSGPLDSTMPPVTGPAWLSLATGQSPGRNGVYGFIQNDPETKGFDFRYLESGSYQNRSIWDYLSNENVSVGVIDYPTLSNPYPVNGFMICGGLGSVGHRCYPESLENKLSKFEKPTGHLDLRDDRYENLSVFFDELLENLRRRRRIALHVLDKQDWVFCWTVIQETDWFQHLMWKCFDNNHHEADTVRDSEREMFRTFWREVDEFVGDCLELIDDETNVILQSDHGFGPMEDRSFRLNTWLKQEGYLTPKSASGLQWRLKKSARRTLSSLASTVYLQELAPSVFQWGRDKTASMAIQFGAIELDETKVFEPGHIGSMGGLYINEAALDSGEDVDTICQEVTEKLSTFAAQRDIDLRVYHPEEFYGHATANAPDLIVRIPGWQIEDGGWNESIVDDRPERLDHQNGSHRVPGILVASGPDFESGTIDNARVWDLAPTLLHLYDLPVPDVMDGRVLEEILSTNRKVKRTSEKTADGSKTSLDQDEQSVMKEQLSDLGYFE